MSTKHRPSVTETLMNWGRWPRQKATIFYPQDVAELAACVDSGPPLIARGNGRCYGDSALQAQVVSMSKLNRFLRFEPEAAILSGQSGLLLSDILRVIVPYGLFLPVVPGTRFITLGGAIAANVHGKNHPQAGSFGSYLQELTLIDAAGQTQACSLANQPKVFAQTIGGMGLTGIITEAQLQLTKIPSAYLTQSYDAFPKLSSLAEELLTPDTDWPYRVAWIDSVHAPGRGILQRGRFSSIDALTDHLAAAPFRPHTDRQLFIPPLPTGHLLNPLLLRTYNAWRYFRQKRQRENSIVHYSQFFFPLDQLGAWNRLYGPRGMVQHQFVLPTSRAIDGLAHIWQCIHRSRERPYLAVLKALGKERSPASPLSFPQKGLSLALDFKRSPGVLSLLERLDKIVLAHGGRIYLAKDARMSATTFARCYPSAKLPGGLFQSAQSQRLSS